MFPIAGFAIPAAGFALHFLLTRARTGEEAVDEIWLAVLLAVAGIVVAINEGLANTQALAWTGIALLLAVPWLVGLRRGRRTPRRQTSQLDHAQRSEEHTSELQSLMRISYAVFCLKKKKCLFNYFSYYHT